MSGYFAINWFSLKRVYSKTNNIFFFKRERKNLETINHIIATFYEKMISECFELFTRENNESICVEKSSFRTTN